MVNTKENLKKSLKETLNGERICDYITRSEENAIIRDFNKWTKTAQSGDAYYYGGCEYKIQ